MSFLNNLFNSLFAENKKDKRKENIIYEIPYDETKITSVYLPVNLPGNSFKILKWHSNVGDILKDSHLICEIETNKFTMEFESFHRGKLVQITKIKEGLKVGDLICKIEN